MYHLFKPPVILHFAHSVYLWASYYDYQNKQINHIHYLAGLSPGNVPRYPVDRRLGPRGKMYVCFTLRHCH
jgi:hypothetical protein